jgi:ligand-binding sensor domain-containing protein/two-component sensor histidine kinase
MSTTQRRKIVCGWISCWLGLLLIPAIAYAERLPIKLYTTADGLAHDRVKRIVRDSRGFLWFCTLEGLSRFDGYRFTTYGREHGLPHAITNDLVETRQGEYWVATHSGVCRFNPGKKTPDPRPKTQDQKQETQDQVLFTVYPVGDEPATNRVSVLYEDRAGRLWAGTDGGLFRLEKINGQEIFRRVEMGLPSRPDRMVGVWALVEDQEGGLWIATWFGLARRLPDGRMVHYGVYLESLFQDREGRLWVGGHGDVVVFKPAPASASVAGERVPWRTLTHHRPDAGGPVRLPANPGEALRFTTADGLPRNPVSGFYQSSDGRIWIVTHHGGLIEFDGHSFRRYTTAHGLSSNWLATLTEDRAGNLWVGTFVNGLMKIARRGFVSYLQADGLAYLRVLSIFENQARQLCVISERGAFHRLDGRRFKAIRPGVPQHVDWDWYHIPFQDHTGEWWVPTEAGLYRFPRASRIEQLAHTRPMAGYTTRFGLTGNQVFSLFEDSQGDIWIGTSIDSRDRLTRWERSTQTFHRYTEADGLPPFNIPSAFCQDAAGNLWIGFGEGGLARYTAGRFTLLTTADGVPDGAVRALFRDHADRLWVATNGGGLGRLDHPGADRLRFVTYTTAEGLASNNVRCITEDRQGRIYVGAGRGVTRLDPATGHMKHFTTADGLANSYVNAAFRDHQGRLWFGTSQGLSQLVPEPDQPEPPPPIWIHEIRIAGVSHSAFELGETEVSELVLEPNQNHLQIDFFGLAFAAGEGLRYQYKLEGADQDWSAPTDQRAVNFANLSPGQYRFVVQAVSADGTVSLTPATVAFTILPPIWQRWWVLTLAVIIGGLAIHRIYRYRVSHLLELERVRTRIAADLHDDIGSSLSRMAILGEVVKQRVAPTNPESAEMLTHMAGMARELVDTMSDVVWSIDPRRDNLNTLILRIGKFASDMLDPHGIACHLQTPLDSEKVKLSPEQRRHLFLIFKEAINNLVRHAECRSVWLTINIADHQLVAEIRDDGRGFTPAEPGEAEKQSREGHGLENLRARAAALGGQLQVISAPDQGTRLTLTVPLF